MTLNVRRLDVPDASLLITLRREALDAEPFAFAASPADDMALAIDSVQSFLGNRETQAVYGHFAVTGLAGMVGLVRAARVKQRHKATIWGMYVQPRSRNKGVGRALLTAAVEQARTWGIDQLQLTVAETASDARRLYEAVGFRLWGCEPRALHWNGCFVDEHHLALDLSEPPSAPSTAAPANAYGATPGG